MHDVAVIGSGPVGSHIAARLVGHGYDVVVLERKQFLSEPVCCTGIIGQEWVRSFSIDEEVIYRQANSATVYSPSGKRIRVWRREPQAVIVNRPALNLYLAELAKDIGAKFLTDSAVTDMGIGGDRVVIGVESGEGCKDTLEARALVIAAGFNPKITEVLGFGRPADFVMGVQAEVEAVSLEEVEVYLGEKVAPGFFAWLVPTLPGRALAGLLSRYNPGEYLKSFLSGLSEQGKIVSAEVELNYGGVPLKSLERTSGTRVIVVGTAAGQTKPTPLILKYAQGGFNTLHQDLYGEVYFPIQVACFLSRPGDDYTGGEFVLAQQVPRAQSKAIVLTPQQGDMIIFTTNFRPIKSSRGYTRASMRHGVSEVHNGERYTVGIIFHDAVS